MCLVCLILTGAISTGVTGMTDSEREWMIRRVEERIDEIGLSSAQTGDSGALGWGEGHILYAIINMFYATGDTKWLDIFKRHVDTALCFLTDHDDDGFLSWHTNYYTPEPARLKAFAAAGNRGTGRIEVQEEITKKESWNTRTVNHRFRVLFLTRGSFIVIDEEMKMPALLSPHSKPGLHWLPIQRYEPGKVVWRARGLRFKISGQPEPGDSFVILPQKAPEYDSVVHDGMMTMPIARFIEIVLSDEKLKERYGETAEGYLAILERHFFEKWMSEPTKGRPVRWVEFPDGRGLFVWEPTSFRKKRTSLPMNQYTAFGRTVIKLWQITGDKRYLDVATKMARMVKSLLKVKDDAYWWYYAEPVADWDGREKPSFVEHTHYADMDVGFMIDAYEAGIVFGEEDMRKLTNTFIKVMWNGSFDDPKVAGDVLGGNGTSEVLCDFVRLAQFDPRVWEICYRINRQSKNIKRLALILACERYVKSGKEP